MWIIFLHQYIALALLTVAAGTGIPAAVAAEDMESRSVHKVRFAVVTGRITGAGESDQWFARGLTFDLEKRLGRLSSLEEADRLEVASALRSASEDSEQAGVAAVFSRIRPDLVLHASGSMANGKLDIVVHLWTDSNGPPASFKSSAETDQLFTITDELIEKIVAHLRSSKTDIGEPRRVSDLHRKTARSVATYGLVIRGMLSLQGGSTAAAKSDLLKALDAEPDNWWALYFLGAAEFHQRRFKESVDYCRKALALDSDLYPAIYANLAYCYQGLGDHAQVKWARDEFERRTGKPLPMRALPGGMAPMGYPRVK